MPAQLIFEDKTLRKISNREEIQFSGFSSWFLIVLTAQTQSNSYFVQIDDQKYPQPLLLSSKETKNLPQTVYLLTFLEGQNHHLILTSQKKQATATFESLEVYQMNLNQQLELSIEKQAKDGDRRPWLTFVLENLPLLSFTSIIIYWRRKRDSDDVKVTVDGQVQFNLLKTIKYHFWRLAGFLLKSGDSSETKTESFSVDPSKKEHLIQFEADRQPFFKKIIFNFSAESQRLKRVPTVEDPKWTGNFNDDSDEILLARLIFGEAEGVSGEAKIAVGWTVKNRVLAQRKEEWGLTYHEVILKPNQYDAFTERLDKLSDPLNTPDETVRQAWHDSFKIATQVISNGVFDPTGGATNFYSTPINSIPDWATQDRFKIQIDNLSFYKL